MRGFLLSSLLLLASALATATPTEAQYYSCASTYWGYTCGAGSSAATCGRASYWGDVSCTDRAGSFGWNNQSWGANGWAYQTGSYSTLLLPSVQAQRTPSYLDSWVTGSAGNSSRYCSLLAALGC